MQLNQLQFVARSRRAYEVFDLAVLMYRQHLWRLILIYALLLTPILVISLLLLPIYWVGVVLWWLKPLLERPLLHYLSKAAFGQPASLIECLASLKQLNWLSMLLKLTVFRFSPYRAFYAAIDQLEGLTGAPASQRKRLLNHSDNPKPLLWTLFCVHLEAIVVFAAAAISFALIPSSYNADALIADLSNNSDQISLIYNLLYAVSISVVAPLYVAGGFLSYLHRRIDLEGWDIELEFRAIKQRLIQKKAASNLLSCCLPIFIALGSLWPPTQANASDIQPQQIQQQIQQLYNEEGVMEKYRSWNVKNDLDADTSELDFDQNWLTVVGNVLGVVFWLLAAAALIWLIYFLYQQQGFFKQQSLTQKNHKKPSIQPHFTRMQHDIADADLLAAAISADKNGQARLALALLLQHILLVAQQTYDIRIKAAMTEQECLQQLSQQLQSAYLPSIERVFHCWIHMAWAHQQQHYQFTQLLADLPAEFCKELTHEA